MTRNILTLSLIFFLKIAIAQTDSTDYSKNPLFVFRTEEDFFNNNKIYKGEYIPSDTRVIKYKHPVTKKRRRLNLEDSCTYYFGYQIGEGDRNIRITKRPTDYSYYLFGGGNKDAYCVVYGHWGHYDKEGYLQSYSAIGGWVYMYFVDRLNNLYEVSLEDFLKSKPKLLEKYTSEKNETEKKVWERNKLATGIKYLKLFIAAQ